MRRTVVLYVLILAVSGVGVAVVLERGSRIERERSAARARLETAEPVPPSATAKDARAGEPAKPAAAPHDNPRHPVGILLLQVVVVVAAAKAVAAVFRRLSQPAVIGEMVAGILLGPSLLGLMFPSAYGYLFPQASMGVLQFLSQVGVVLFMFGVGMDLQLGHVRERAQTALLVSHTGIVVPFVLGVALSLAVYHDLAPAHVGFVPFALFVGVAMSITAFPVLARIIADRGLTTTPLGTTAIACAAIDDATAWCLLAVVVAIAKANGLGRAAFTIVLTLAFAVVMLLVIRPRIARIFVGGGTRQSGRIALAAGILAFVFISALSTEAIGIHALFGAFLAGVVVSSHAPLRGLVREPVDMLGSVVLLPLFFAFAGLRTQMGLLTSSQSWMTCGALIAVAIAGKLGGCTIAARLTGMSLRDSLSLGTLMNTRGLMELIVLNVGYDLRILSPAMFAMMILMALVTTCMTNPLMSAIESVADRHDSLRY